jgi:hypothetical protein
MRRLIESVVSDTKVADKIYNVIVAAYVGVPTDHSEEHISKVYENTTKHLVGTMPFDVSVVPEKYSEMFGLLRLIGALGHDISDDKFANNKERWTVFIASMREIIDQHYSYFQEDYQFDFIKALTFIIDNIGVSKEATRNYTEKKTTEEWRNLTDPVFGKLFGMFVRWTRHLISGADIMEASGAIGQIRAVEHNRRLLLKRGLDENSEEFRKEIVEGVRWVHVNKHAKLCRWVHIPSMRIQMGALWKELMDAYIPWDLANGGTGEYIVMSEV